MSLAMDERGVFETNLPRIDQNPVRVIETPRRRFRYSLRGECWRMWIFGGIVDTPNPPPLAPFKALMGVPTWSIRVTT